MNSLSHISDDDFIREEVAIFCGAGISKNSGLPLANELKEFILEKLFSSLSYEEKEMFHHLPFESFMEVVSENSNEKIWDIFKLGQPNSNHILIAKLASKGYLKTVYTTNFDCLIEKAFKNEGLVENISFIRYYDEKGLANINYLDLEDKITLFKLHGTIDHLESLRATLKKVALKRVNEKWYDSIKYLVRDGKHKKILILGYSCSDMFDITPQIENLAEKSNKEIVFVNHAASYSVENINTQSFNDPFRKYHGIKIHCNTNKYIESLWKQTNLGNYIRIINDEQWSDVVSRWLLDLKSREYTLSLISGRLFHIISEFEKAQTYYYKSIEIANKEEDKYCEILGYSNLGLLFLDQGDFYNANRYHLKALRMSKKDRHAHAISLLNVGVAQMWLGNKKKAIIYFNKSLNIIRENGFTGEECICNLNLGFMSMQFGNFKRAIKYLESASSIASNQGEIKNQALCYFNLGEVYSRLGDKQKELEFRNKCIETATLICDRSLISENHIGFGNYYADIGYIDIAFKHFETAYQIAIETKNRVVESQYYINTGLLNAKIGNVDKAIDLLNIYLDNFNGVYYDGLCYLNLGFCYILKKDFTKAEDCFEKSIEYSIKCGDKKIQYYSYLDISYLYLVTEEFDKSLGFLNKSLAIAKQSRNLLWLATIYERIGIYYSILGNRISSLKNYLHVEKILLKKNSFDELEKICGTIFLIYEELGDIDNSKKYIKKIEYYQHLIKKN